MAAKATPTVAQVGSVKVVSAVSPGMRGAEEESDYIQDQALKFLKEHLYGDRHERTPGDNLVHGCYGLDT